jgi:hypothetical protein
MVFLAGGKEGDMVTVFLRKGNEFVNNQYLLMKRQPSLEAPS